VVECRAAQPGGAAREETRVGRRRRRTPHRLPAWEDRGEAVIDLARHVAGITSTGTRTVFAEVVATTVDILRRYDDEGRSVVDMDRDSGAAAVGDLQRGARLVRLRFGYW
jgi:hypothetical protein